MNLTPADAVLKVIPGRVARLPSITQWLSVVVDKSEQLRISQSDMACAFYLFRLPQAWTRLLSFNLSFRGHEIGLNEAEKRNKLWYLSCQVLPMGWSSAVGVMQEAAELILLRGDWTRRGSSLRRAPCLLG